jgi:hypothetical protein
MENKLNLFQKIQAVSMEVMNIEKNLTVGAGSYGYKAVSDTDVTLQVKKAEAKHGIISIPIKQDMVSSEALKVIRKGEEAYTFVDVVKMTTRFIDLDNTDSFIDVESFGRGVDNSDKGLGKASTYCRKYALLNAYKIATGSDPDADKSEKIQAPQTVDEKRVLILNKLSTDGDLCTKVLGHFGVESKEDLTDKYVNKLYQTWTTKGAL